MATKRSLRWWGPLALAAALAATTPAGARQERSLEQRLDELARRNEALEREVRTLRGEVRELRETARSGEPDAPTPVAAGDGDLASRSLGGANLRLLDISLDTLFAAGFSTADDAQLENLQAGGHDPRQRGFTLQNVELSLLGAVDPFMTGEAHLIYFLDPGGGSRFELEEAFLTTQALPFALEEHGLQLEAGHFFTEVGRINPVHPHAWDWLDQPVVLSRLFGADGMRGPGFRLGWLAPLPWFSELHLGMQDAEGETMASFRASQEFFGERAVGGRPFAGRAVSGLDDFVYLARWVNGLDLSDTLSTQLGASFLAGANATGSQGSTRVYGGDWVLKWRPLLADRGWPFAVFQTEFLYRDYRADDFTGCPLADASCPADALLPDRRLGDWGFDSQLLWGFRRGWAAGLRFELASGHGDGVAFDAGANAFVDVPRNADPHRSTRRRLSPLLVFHPSEFSRLRLQYNYDDARDLNDRSQHSLWAGVEFLFGAHAAHAY